MYEKSVESVTENLSTDMGVFELSVSDNGVFDLFGTSGDGQLSAGSSAGEFEAAGSVSENMAVSAGDSVYPLDNTGYAETAVENSQLLEIAEGVKALNGTVMLLLFFLLITWAEKKLNVVVHRFSGRR